MCVVRRRVALHRTGLQSAPLGDNHPKIGPDIEGMTLLSPSEILISSDNDLGVEGAETGFWLIILDGPPPAR
ncbi:MAG: hypothetical protein ABL956_17325 [Hyphomonadaceae bacterium]